MIRRSIAVLLVAPAAFALVSSAASAGHARHCADSIKAHHTTCRVAEKVLGKWAEHGYSGGNFRAAGSGWHCRFKGESAAFDCFSNLSARVSGHIDRRIGRLSRGVVAASNNVTGDRRLHQDFELIGGAIDYHLVARDPAGLYPYCTTVQLEKPGRKGWRPVPGKYGRTHRHDCFRSPEEGESRRDSFAAWDTILYPRGLMRKLRRGELRMHGFTDLGGELIYRSR